MTSEEGNHHFSFCSDLFYKIVTKISALSTTETNADYLFSKGQQPNERQKQLLIELFADLQLPSGAGNELDSRKYQELAENKFDFLIYNNAYLQLYHFLHKKEFRHFQQEELKLYFGLFSYEDDATKQYRYLVSSQDHPLDEGKEPPHFFLSAFHYDDQLERGKGGFKLEKSETLGKIMDAFYYYQKKQPSQNINYGRLFSKKIKDLERYKKKRTQFERDNDLLYVPSGELDTCILCFFLMIQDDLNRRKMLEISYSQSSIQEKCEQFKSLRLKLDWDLIHDAYIPNKPSRPYFPYTRRHVSILEWMVNLGLVKPEKGDEGFRFTERGRRMIKWFAGYLKVIRQKAYNDDIYYLLSRMDEDSETDVWLNPTSESFRHALAGHYNLKIQDFNNRLDNFLSLFENNKDLNSWDSVYSSKVFCEMIAILSAWDEKTLNVDKRLILFQRRCRFDLVGHFMLRGIDRSYVRQPATASIAWIVFPILRDSKMDLLKEKNSLQNKEVVGFFHGAIKDSDEKGEGFFEQLGEEYTRNKFLRLINDNKTIINTLARVENREIYYNGIKREAEQFLINNQKERMFAHANKYLYGSISSDAGLIEETLKNSQYANNQHLLNIVTALYLKTRLLSDNSIRREQTNKETGAGDYDRTWVKMETFFQYLFIRNKYSAQKTTYNLNEFKEESLNALRKVLFLEKLKELPGLENECKLVFRILFEEMGISLDIPDRLEICLPTWFHKEGSLFYFNFIAIVNNFFKHWVKVPKKGDSFIFHVRYIKESKRLYLLESKEGENVPRRLNFNNYGSLHEFTTSPRLQWKKMPYDKYNIGINDVEMFFRQFFNANYSLYRHKEKIKEVRLGVPQEREEYMAFQRITGVSPNEFRIKGE
ncbi:MAG: hypothetical protein DWQ02_20900 [Bacteroidetes bacterium]|nr:MAG: hypothetical protein DWQ02_20900 [Bacteroidota bacterium]